MTIQRSVVAVPARLESSRLPGKVLAEIGGKPMIQRVLERCAQAQGPAAVVLCTDSERLRDLAENWGVSVLMTAETCSSGSERIASVSDALVALAWGEDARQWDQAQRQARFRQLLGSVDRQGGAFYGKGGNRVAGLNQAQLFQPFQIFQR